MISDLEFSIIFYGRHKFQGHQSAFKEQTFISEIEVLTEKDKNQTKMVVNNYGTTVSNQLLSLLN
jgi:hypothetical protein